MLAPTPLPVVLRLMSNYDIDEHGCWISRYSTGSHGYSQIGWQPTGARRSVMRLGHRVAYEAANGPIPEGMTVDHICRVRRCINPDHLRLLTNVENGRLNAQFLKTHCVHGHPFDEANTRRDKHGWRRCLTCQREANKRRAA